jgi:hypothetical protein
MRVDCYEYDFEGIPKITTYNDGGKRLTKIAVRQFNCLDQAIAWILDKRIFLPISFVETVCIDDKKSLRPG